MMLMRLALFFFLISCISTQASYEEPLYTSSHNFENIEIRKYKKFLVAEVVQDGATRKDVMYKSFRLLADYISGQNKNPEDQKEVKIEMTRPVIQQKEKGKWKMSFFMPRQWNSQTLPRPQNKNVLIQSIQQRNVAAITFSGTWTDKNLKTHEEKLKTYLTRNKYKILKGPIYAFYNSPMTPWFLRRNEVMYVISK